jgi:hypothetical protein
MSKRPTAPSSSSPVAKRAKPTEDPNPPFRSIDDRINDVLAKKKQVRYTVRNVLRIEIFDNSQKRIFFYCHRHGKINRPVYVIDDFKLSLSSPVVSGILKDPTLFDRAGIENNTKSKYTRQERIVVSRVLDDKPFGVHILVRDPAPKNHLYFNGDELCFSGDDPSSIMVQKPDQRSSYMDLFNTREETGDVVFVCSDGETNAHKLILAQAGYPFYDVGEYTFKKEQQAGRLFRITLKDEDNLYTTDEIDVFLLYAYNCFETCFHRTKIICPIDNERFVLTIKLFGLCDEHNISTTVVFAWCCWLMKAITDVSCLLRWLHFVTERIASFQTQTSYSASINDGNRWAIKKGPCQYFCDTYPEIRESMVNLGFVDKSHMELFDIIKESYTYYDRVCGIVANHWGSHRVRNAINKNKLILAQAGYPFFDGLDRLFRDSDRLTCKRPMGLVLTIRYGSWHEENTNYLATWCDDTKNRYKKFKDQVTVFLNPNSHSSLQLQDDTMFSAYLSEPNRPEKGQVWVRPCGLRTKYRLHCFLEGKTKVKLVKILDTSDDKPNTPDFGNVAIVPVSCLGCAGTEWINSINKRRVVTCHSFEESEPEEYQREHVYKNYLDRMRGNGRMRDSSNVFSTGSRISKTTLLSLLDKADDIRLTYRDVDNRFTYRGVDNWIDCRLDRYLTNSYRNNVAKWLHQCLNRLNQTPVSDEMAPSCIDYSGNKTSWLPFVREFVEE